MKLKVTQQTLSMFKANFHNILLLRSYEKNSDNNMDIGAQLYVVDELESIIEEEEKLTRATWFQNYEITKVTNIYITHIVIKTVHPTGKFLGSLKDILKHFQHQHRNYFKSG